MKNNQIGRSMIEMLGVLAIIGVLSVGGMDLISKARRDKQVASMLGNISNLSSTILQNRKYAQDVKESYGGNYALFLQKIGRVPGELKYSSGYLETELNTKIYATIDDDNVVTIKITELDKTICTRVASNDWGNRRNNRLLGVAVNGAASKAAGDFTAHLTVGDATAACNDANGVNTVYLGYQF